MRNMALKKSLAPGHGENQNHHELSAAALDENTYQQILNENFVIAKTDLAGNIIEVNDQFCKLSGYSRDELIGANHKILNSGHHDKEFFKNLWQTIISGETWRGVIKNKNRHGDFYWMDTIITPLKDSDGVVQGYLSTRFDITKRMQEQIDYQRKKNFALLGEITAQTLHDVKNQIAVISLLTSKMKRLLRNKKEIKLEQIEKIDNAVLKTRSIFDCSKDILHSGGMNNDNEKIFEFNEIIDECLENFKGLAEENHLELIIKKTNQDLSFKGNSAQITRVINNLIQNAIEAITQQIPPVEEGWVQVETSAKNDQLFLRITDSGPGIKKESRAHIFDNLFSTKLESGGSGMGLGICKKIIESHGGCIKLDDESEYTCFTITLPLVK